MNKINKILISLSTFLLGSVLIVHGYLSSYTRLIGDDFCSVYFAERLGLLRSIWYWRINWSGRYSAFATDWFLAKVIGVTTLLFIPPVLIIIWILLVITAIYSALGEGKIRQDNKLTSIVLGFLFLFLVFSLTPDILQSFYWWNGMRSYALPLIILTLFYVLFQWLLPKLDWRLLAAISFLLLFFSGGLGETSAIFQLSLLIFLLAVNWFFETNIQRSKIWVILTAGILGTVISLVVIITAPGNELRQVQLHPTPNLESLIRISLIGFWEFLAETISTPEKITAIIGALLLTAYLGGLQSGRIRATSRQIVIAVVGGILLAFACFPPGVFGYSEPPPARVLIIPVYALAVFMLYASFLTGVLLREKYTLSAYYHQSIFVVAVLLLGYSSVTQFSFAYTNRSTFSSFAIHWEDMDAQILAAKDNGEDLVTLPFKENWAGLNVPTDNPRFWVNECYSKYYGIQVFGAPVSTE